MVFLNFHNKHNLFTNNCHSHVAEVLNNLNYRGRKDWNMVSIWYMCLSESNYVR